MASLDDREERYGKLISGLVPDFLKIILNPKISLEIHCLPFHPLRMAAASITPLIPEIASRIEKAPCPHSAQLLVHLESELNETKYLNFTSNVDFEQRRLIFALSVVKLNLPTIFKAWLSFHLQFWIQIPFSYSKNRVKHL